MLACLILDDDQSISVGLSSGIRDMQTIPPFAALELVSVAQCSDCIRRTLQRWVIFHVKVT